MCVRAVSTLAVRSSSGKLAAYPKVESLSSETSWVTRAGMISRMACGKITNRIACQ